MGINGKTLERVFFLFKKKFLDVEHLISSIDFSLRARYNINYGKGLNMEQVYDGRKYKIYSKVEIPKDYGELDEKSYLYFIQVNGQVYHKVGETCNIIQRMKQHCKSYNATEITILWISPALSVYTAKRIEKKVIKEWQQREGWEYKRNDRFIIPNDVTEITIPIRKNYNFSIR